MVEKIPVKTTIVIFLLGTIVLALCACVDPVSIEEFFKDEEYVQKRVDDLKAKVKIHPGSDSEIGSPQAGYEKITGLATGNYYMLEEYDDSVDSEKVLRTLFIKPDGGYLENLGGIGRFTGTQITPLKNYYTYKIKKAKPFDPGDPGTYEFFKFGKSNKLIPAESSTEDGITTVLAAIPSDDVYYLDLAHEIDPINYYEVMKVPSDWGISWGNSSRQSAFYNNTKGGSISTIGSDYTKKYGNEIGIYQYRDNIAVSTGSVNLSDPPKSIIELPSVNVAKGDYVFAEYGDSSNVKRFIFLTVDVKYATTIDDFTVDSDSLTQTYPNITDVIIQTNEERGNITIYYEGLGDTEYDKSDELPTNAGTYTVTFDVTAAGLYAAAKGLSAGTLTINKGTPTEDDYTVSENINQKEGHTAAVTVTKKDGIRSPGVVTVYYEGIDGTIYPKNTINPTTAGTYKITFNVAEDINWNPVEGLYAGLLTITEVIYVKTSNIVLSFKPTGAPNPDTVSFDGSEAEYSDPDNTPDSTLTLTLKVSGLNGNTFKWYLDYLDDNNDYILLGSGKTFITVYQLTSENVKWWQPGTHTITLIVDDKYSFTATFETPGGKFN